MLKKLLAAATLAMMLAIPVKAQDINPPKGLHGKVYAATMALEATSIEGGINTPRLICTVTAYKKIQSGYLLIGAGHCTPANEELPSDMKFYVADNLGGKPQPVYLLKSVMDEPNDWAIYYFPTKVKYPTIELGDEHTLSVGDKTVNVNFSLGIAKMVSEGIVSSIVVPEGQGAAAGFFVDNEFASHGASGSSVVSEKSHKIVGLLIMGVDGATVGNWIEPISAVEADIKGLNTTERITAAMTHPPAPVVVVAPASPSGSDHESTIPMSLFIQGRSHNGDQRPRGSQGDRGHEGHGNKGADGRGRDGRRLDRNVHHRLDSRHDVRFVGGYRQVYWGGFWFGCEAWPEWIFTEDVYFQMGPNNVWFVYGYNNPGLFVQVMVVE